MRITTGSLVVVCSLTFAAASAAHHAFAPVYDRERSVTIQGVVAEFRFINPHTLMKVDVTDKGGKVTQWIVEFSGRLNLSEMGWTEKSVMPGETVTVTGNPTHTNSPRMFFQRLVKSDGTALRSSGAERLDAVEEVRRQRARERQR